ncbi:hypothetical protein Dimus_007512 [Dionaea muscipula]
MAVDHYKVLGVEKNATKEEIKQAFRRLALKFHPDRHPAAAGSCQSARDHATLRFKQISEAYEVLSDDRRRAAYNFTRNSRTTGGGGYYHYGNHGYGGSSGSSYYRSKYRGATSSSSGTGYGWVSRLEIALRFLTTRAFLLNVAFAGILLGGSVVIDASRETLWKMKNSGKSFEEAMESIEKNKARKDEP